MPFSTIATPGRSGPNYTDGTRMGRRLLYISRAGRVGPAAHRRRVTPSAGEQVSRSTGVLRRRRDLSIS